MHKNIKTVAGCLTRVTCNISAPEGVDTTLRAYLVYEGESRPATMESADVIIFPAVPYGHYAYEIRCGGKPVAFGHLLVRASAFPHTDGVVDYALGADLSETEALSLSLSLTPGPRGPKGEDGDPAVFAALVSEHADDATAHVTPEERTAWNAAAAGGGGGVQPEQVASIVGSTFKLAVGSEVPKGSADSSSIALGGRAENRSLSIGCESRADVANDAIAIGYKAKGYGSNGVSIGAGSWCTGEMAIAIGHAADASQKDGVAIGTRAVVNKEGSIALGYGCNANGARSIAIGYDNAADGDFCFCVGTGAQVNMENSFAIGKCAVASNYNSGVLGEEATSYSDCALLLGAKHRTGDVAVTLELLANDLESVAAGSHEGGLKGDTVAFKGGALRFSLVDKLAGKRLCATVTMAQLFELLCKTAGGAQAEFGAGGYYSY